jgi:hypothetical protein
MKPGIYPGLPMADYLTAPAVSASVLKTLLDECPAKAWHESWLNPSPSPKEATDGTDKGEVAHEIFLLGSESCVAVIDPDDHPAEKTHEIPKGWTNKSIRTARDEARLAGKIPILAHKMTEIRVMVDAAHSFIAGLRDTEPAIWQMFQPDGGDSELTIVAHEGDTLCRIRPDRISKDRMLVGHYKTTGTSAEPDRWGRTQFLEYYFGAAFYRRIIRTMFGVPSEPVYLVQETAEPYLCSLIGCDPHSMELGASKVAAGLAEWQRCAKNGRWPGYPNRTVYPEIPVWEDAKWEAREILSFEERLLLGTQA